MKEETRFTDKKIKTYLAAVGESYVGLVRWLSLNGMRALNASPRQFLVLF